MIKRLVLLMLFLGGFIEGYSQHRVTEENWTPFDSLRIIRAKKIVEQSMPDSSRPDEIVSYKKAWRKGKRGFIGKYGHKPWGQYVYYVYEGHFIFVLKDTSTPEQISFGGYMIIVDGVTGNVLFVERYK